MAEKSKSQVREVTLSRILKAPIDLVWKMWTDPKHVSQWWGPTGFRNPVCEWIAKPKNKILIHMQGPEEVIYLLNGVFTEVVKPDRLVFTTSAINESGKKVLEVAHTVNFSTQGNNTELSLHVEVLKVVPEGETHLDGMDEGWKQTLDKLEDHLSQSDRELLFERVLNAPRELVFEVLTNPDHLKKWFGPDGFTLTTHSMEAKTNGIWKFMMHGPDGRNYPNKIKYLEVEKPKKLIYQHLDDIDTEGVSFHVTMTLDPIGRKTKLTMKMVFDTAEDLQRVAREYGAIEGAHQTLGRLDVLVSDLTGYTDRQIVTTRVFNTSVNKLFNAWTDPKILAKWWGPHGFSNTFHKYEFKPGGKWEFTMHGSDGKDFKNECVFIHIEEPQSISWHHLGSHNFYVVVSFEGDFNQTKVTFRMIFDSKEDCDLTKKYAIEKNEENFDRLQLQLGE